MADKSKIEWCDATWNPVTGCEKISPGCDHCYAERMSKRLAGRHGYDAENPFKITIHPERLYQPMRWKRPRKIFTCSMGDLFHEKVSYNMITDVMFYIRGAPQHIFMLLTKRPLNAKAYFEEYMSMSGMFLPMNLWFGVTAENQKMADERIPVLLGMPFLSVRFVSVEPMLEKIDIDNYLLPRNESVLDWVICGGESGPDARKMDPMWAIGLRNDCERHGVPFFFKRGSGICGSPELAGRIYRAFPEVP